MWCCVPHIRCASQHGSAPSHSGLCWQGCDSKGGEATPGFNQRPERISENRGFSLLFLARNPSSPSAGSGSMESLELLVGLLSTARLVSFHSSSQISVFPPGCAVGRLLGVQPVQQQPLLPFPRRRGRRSQMAEPSSVTCHVQLLTGSKTGGHPPKYPN